MSRNLISYSKKIKKYATEILKRTDVVNILSEFGVVEIGGAYDLDVMYDPDIDICVVCENPRCASVAALNRLVDLRLFQKYEYGDFEKFKRENRPEGFIIVLKLEHKKVKWEIEVWFLKCSNRIEKEFHCALKKSLDLKMKLKILKQKEVRETRGLNKHQLSSFSIYKTLLEN
ncbi:MAG: hypothetical protein WC842_00105 [Candidatus Paceibacterota bacterium]|jgi:hypothetical protein